LLANIYLERNDFDKAALCYNQALDYAKEFVKEQPGNDEFEMRHIYPHLGEYYIRVGNYEAANKWLTKVLNLYIKKKLYRGDGIGRARNQLATVYYYMGDYRKAEEMCTLSDEENMRAPIPSLDDLIIARIMIGRAQAKQDKTDQALVTFQKLLKVLRKTTWGTYKVEQADVLNLVAQLYSHDNKFSQAREALEQAMRLRRETGTESHPNYAASLQGLAGLCAANNQLTSAATCAAESLRLLDAAVLPTHPRIAPTLIALVSIDILTSHSEQISPLNARLETILQEPLGPWKEEFLDTVQFYAGLLKKAGKTEDAAQLEQLYARQKDKR
jgi:tetratricopeptide (TPR) repeat protein